MSDVEDEELAALRAAALASLKSRTEKPSFPSSNESNHITPINTVVASTSNYSPYPEISGYSNQYSWRNPGQASRRTRGNRPFPKVSQRSSNLIVITPVNTEDKDSTSHLVLPQHKWCQSANEDSSSPKTYRRTGPTRFNRLESGSESSDSDYDNSDNDSYSNETILQDEPSDHFAGRSGDSIGNESSPEKPVPERRFSFQNIDSDLNLEGFQGNESTSVYKCLKTTYPSKSEEKTSFLRSPSVENDSEHSWKHESRRNYAYRQYDASVENKHSEHTDCSYSAKLQTVNGGSPKKHKMSSVLSVETESSRSSRRHGEVSLDNGSHSDLNSKRKLSNSDQSKLSDNDLRLELKKRMHEFQSRSGLSQKQSESPDSQSPGRSRSRDRSHLRSSRSRDRSEGKNHIHSSSSSQRHARSRSKNGHHSQSPRRNRSQSPRRNSSQSPRRNRSQSPRRNRSQSPRRNRSQSPHRNRSKRWSPSPEKNRSEQRHRRRDRSRSPVCDRKRDRSPHRNHKRDRNSSQDRKRDDGRKSGQRSRHHRGHSHSSSASSSSSSTTSNSTSSLPLRSISSVIKPVQPKDSGVKHEKGIDCKGKRTASSSESDSHYSPKKNKKLDENSIATNVKSSVYGSEIKSSASDGNKRVPVHMRLGSLPGKRIIQMTKDVEAAFVNTSSDDADEEVNGRRRKDNFHVVCDINDNKSDESSKKHYHRNLVRSTDAPKDRRLKHRR